MKKSSLLFTIASLLVLTSCNTQKASMAHPKPLMDYVIDIGTIKNFDEEKAINIMKERFYPHKAGCSAVVTQVNGNNLVGRNCDISVSDSPIMKFELDINKYKTLGFMYPLFEENTEYENIMKNGLNDYLQSVIPFAGADYLNEKGLYIEMNMRNPEEGYDVTSTNPQSDVDLYAVSFPAYASTRCETVDEAVELAKSINLYTNPVDEESNIPSWNYGFTLADAYGNYGVLEIAKNKVFYTPNQNGQANFYIADELKQNTKYQCGESRFQVLNEGLDKVKTKSDMLNHMAKTYYSYAQNFIDVDQSPYDIRSEWTEAIPVNDQGMIDEENGTFENCTTEWLLDDSRKEEVYSYIENSNQESYGEYLNSDGSWNLSKLRKSFGDMDEFWMSMYSVAVDCKEKTMKVRFFENSAYELEFSI